MESRLGSGGWSWEVGLKLGGVESEGGWVGGLKLGGGVEGWGQGVGVEGVG